MSDDNPNWHDVYLVLYPHRSKGRKVAPAPAFVPDPPRRHRRSKPDMGELESQFIAEMRAIGRHDLADDEEGAAFDRWLKRRGIDT